jgi:ribosomal protein L7/L12
MNSQLVIAGCAIAAVVLTFLAEIRFRLRRLSERVAILTRVEAKLDLLLKNAGLEFNPCKDVAPAISEALRSGQKIQAIKLYRKSTNCSLAKAKEYVEGVQRQMGVA